MERVTLGEAVHSVEALPSLGGGLGGGMQLERFRTHALKDPASTTTPFFNMKQP